MTFFMISKGLRDFVHSLAVNEPDDVCKGLATELLVNIRRFCRNVCVVISFAVQFQMRGVRNMRRGKGVSED